MGDKRRGFSFLFGVFLFAIISIISLSLISADFTLGNKSSSIEKVYGPSETVKGWVNISLQNEPTTSLLKDSTGKSISILELMKKRGSYVYTCSPLSCSNDYNADNGEVTKTFNIENGSSRLIGLKFTGVLTGISSVNMHLTSSAGAGCENQISVDFFDDGIVDWINNKSTTSTSCTNLRSYGCFDSTKTTEENIVSTTPYCEKINLTKSPGFILGSWMKKNSGALNLEAAIYDVSTGAKVAKCVSTTVTGEEFSCSVDYTITQPKEYFVCVYSTSGTGDYKVRGNTNPTKGCGFYGIPPPSTTPFAYQIFAEGKTFDSVGAIDFKNSVSGKNLANLVYEYITKTYGTTDCTNGCVVPIRISGINQQVSLSDLSVSYSKTSGAVTENNFYELVQIPARINSDFQNVYVNEAGFTVPSNKGAYRFDLSLNDKSLLSENLNVSDVPLIVAVYPTSTAAGYPTNFVLDLDSSTAITKYTWDFGDNTSSVNTTMKSVIHTYSEIGKYTVSVTATDSKALSSTKDFEIEVNSPKNLISTLLNKSETSITNVKSQQEGLDEFSKSSIESVLQISKKETNLTSIRNLFDSATTETEYSDLVPEVLALGEIPQSVSKGLYASSLNFLSSREAVNFEAIKSATKGREDVSGKESKYLDAITFWNHENLDTKVTYTEFLGDYDGELRSVVKVFTLDLTQKKEITGDYYLIVPSMENLRFDDSTTASKEGEYTVVNLKGKQQVSFSTTGDYDFSNIPAVISPPLSRLSIEELNIQTEEEPRWTVLILVLIFLGIVALTVYIILQEWYKRRYENYLFKNKNDLFNMATYIHNSKKKGMDNKKIEESLKKAKWSSEQIRYAMKKYAGERTGMFEIPITTAANLVKKKEKEAGKDMSNNHKKL